LSGGGIGIQSSITGTPIYYAGGGGAVQNKPGGLGGGGNGGQVNVTTGYTEINSVAGTDGLGGGGGGGLTNIIPVGNPYGVPPKGGSGVVIIRYLNPVN
jgi:hypothetical protein